MKLNLQKKNVIVTGSTRGIGLSIARGFLDEGCNLCITSRSKTSHSKIKKKLQREYSENQIISFPCDFTNRRNVQELKYKISKVWKKIDVFVCNVGSGIGSNKYLPNYNEWSRSWSINFESALISSQIFSSYLEKSGGTIIYISSIAGIETINAPVEYSVAKSSLISLAKNMVSKLGDKFRVNVIAPGNIYFKGGSWDRKLKENRKQILKMIKEKVPMNRFGSPEEVSSLCVFLASKRSEFINGSVITIDGGQTNKI